PSTPLVQRPSHRHPPALHSFPTRRSSDLHLCTRADEFREQMAYVRQRCHPIALEELARAAREDRIPDGAVAVTLDDGYFDALARSEEHTSELQSRGHLVCRLLLEKKKRRQ